MSKPASTPKRINFRAVLILTGATVTLALLVYGLHAFQVQRTASGLRDQADLFKQAGQHDLALATLEQYLGLVPEDNEALAKLGFWLDERAKSPSQKSRAFLILKHALRRDEQQVDVQRKVAQLAI